MIHKVNKLSFELAGAPNERPQDLQHRLSLFANNELIPALGTAFDKLVPQNQTITLDRLEIKLSGLKINQLEEQILVQIETYLSPHNLPELQRIMPEFKQLTRSNSKQIELVSEVLEKKQTNKFSSTKNLTSGSQLDLNKSNLEFLIEFLKTGNLSWNSIKLTTDSIIEILTELTKGEAHFQNFISKHLSPNPDYVLRLLNSIGLDEYQQIIFNKHRTNLQKIYEKASLLYIQIQDNYTNQSIRSNPQNWSGLQKIIFMTNLLTISAEKGLKLSLILDELHDLIISQKNASEPFSASESTFIKNSKFVLNLVEIIEKLSSANTTTNLTISDVVKESGSSFEATLDNKDHEIYLTEIEPQEAEFDDFFEQINSSNTASKSTTEIQEEISSLSGFLHKINQANSNQKKSLNPEQQNQFRQLEHRLATLKNELKQLLSSELDKPPVSEQKSTEEEARTYFVENAGLVVVAPYLGLLFDNLHLRQNKEFIDEEALFKALKVTAYICFGEEEFQEHQLTLNKILCGFNPEDSIDLNHELTKDEKVIINDMLSSVIANWPTLKNTGIGSFRNTFIKRNGILKPVAEGNWFIKIERTAFDVLLDTLPWPISVHRYSWMTKLLTVEW